MTRNPLCRGVGVPQGPSGRVRKILHPPGFDPRIAQPVDSRYTYYSIPAHSTWIMSNLILKSSFVNPVAYSEFYDAPEVSNELSVLYRMAQ